MFAHIALAFLAVSSAMAAPLNGHHHVRGYAKDAHKLEPYNQFRTRYNELGCSQEQGNDFYKSCCHPLLKGQSLSSRPDYCDPNSSYYSDCHSTTTESPSDTYTPTTTTTSTPPANPSPTTTPSSTITSPDQYHPKATPTTTTTTTAAGGGGGGGNWNTGGVATFFYQNGVAGACGQVHSDSDLIAAIDQQRYGDASQKSSLCGKQVHIVNTENGNSVVVTIADDCPSCENGNSIDLSTGAFDKLAP